MVHEHRASAARRSMRLFWARFGPAAWPFGLGNLGIWILRPPVILHQPDLEDTLGVAAAHHEQRAPGLRALLLGRPGAVGRARPGADMDQVAGGEAIDAGEVAGRQDRLKGVV
jgi:hypothetical protein